MSPETPAAEKTCPMCGMAIPFAAKKCPHCLHFQSRASLLANHPAVPFAIFGTMVVIFIWAIESVIFDRGESFEKFAGQVEVVDTRFTFGDRKDGATIAVIGTMRNRSVVPWKDIQFQVEFRDAQGKIIDAAQKEEYSLTAPAGQSLPIKISLRREFSETNYASHAIRIIAAKDARTRW